MKQELAISNSAIPATLLQTAIEKGTSMDQLRELMELQERWEKKEARKAFFDALSQFQTLVPVIKKSKTAKIQTKTGGNYSYKFADLGNISQQIKSALQQCGLSYRWEFQDNQGKLKVTCYVSHRDGHTETTSMESAMDNSGAKNDIQQKGSTQTYLQRYTLIGALGLSTADEDNDAANHPTTNKEERTEQEILDEWKQVIAGVKRQVELTSLYMKNKKVVDNDDKIKALFKAREVELKASKTQKETVSMP